MNLLKKISLGAGLILGSLFAAAQEEYEVGLNVGTLIYQGDLTPTKIGSLKTPGLSFGIMGLKHISPSVAIRLDFTIGTISGDDKEYTNPAWRKQRGLAFSTSIKELSASVMYKPLPDALLSPYIFGGVGMAFTDIHPYTESFNKNYFLINEPITVSRLAEDMQQTLPKSIVVFPVGFGARYQLNENFSMHAEFSYRIMSTDYLDGFSKIAETNKNDHYYKACLGFIYTINE